MLGPSANFDGKVGLVRTAVGHTPVLIKLCLDQDDSGREILDSCVELREPEKDKGVGLIWENCGCR